MPRVPYVTDQEIERRMEDRLHRARMMPTRAEPVLNLEAFVEHNDGLDASLDEFAPLPAEVMGVVTFLPGERDRMEINRDLSELGETDATARARCRSTIAHESGHIVLHRDLLMPCPDQMSLFSQAEEPVGYTQTCLKQDFGLRSSASREEDYLEIQANKGMAALLLPRQVFYPMAEEALRSWESRRYKDDARDHFEERKRLVRGWADLFEVSRQVIEIRLRTLNLWGQAKQGRLF